MKKTLFIPFLMAGFTTIAIAEEDNHNNIPSGQCEEAPMMPHYQRFTPPPMPAWVKQRIAQRQMRMQAPRFQQWRNAPMRPRFNTMNMPMQRPMMPRMPVRPAYYGRPVYSNNGWGNGYGNSYGASNGGGYGNGSGNGDLNSSGDMDGSFNFGFNGKAKGNGNADANAKTQNNVQGNARSQANTDYQGQANPNQVPISTSIPASAPAPTPISVPVVAETEIVLTDTDKDNIVDVADLCPNTATGMQVDAFGCDKAASIVLRGVNFKINSDELTADSTQILDIVVATLIANPGLALELTGHTDSDGEAAYNKDLSQRRAARVLTYFAEHDVDVSKMKASGFGEEQPIASNDTAEGKAINRRVEVNRL